jgi:hypothetical protein
MWDDQPVSRPNPAAEMPPPTRAFLSQFNRSFTPPALINDPYVVDRKLTVTPFLFGTRPLFKPRNPFAVDPTVERAHHYIRPKQKTDAELCASPRLAAIPDEEDWSSDEEKKALAMSSKPKKVALGSHKNGNTETNKSNVIPAFSFRILEPEPSDNAKPDEREDGDGSDRVTLDVQQFFRTPQMMNSGPSMNESHSDSTGATWDEWD